MIWLVLEGVLALSLFVFIIWWTMPRKRKDAGEEAIPRHEDTEKHAEKHKEETRS